MRALNTTSLFTVEIIRSDWWVLRIEGCSERSIATVFIDAFLFRKQAYYVRLSYNQIQQELFRENGVFLFCTY